MAIVFHLTRGASSAQPPPDPPPLRQISCPHSGLHSGRTSLYRNYIPFLAADARARTPQQTEHWGRVSCHELVANPPSGSPTQPLVDRCTALPEWRSTSSVGVPTPPHRPHHFWSPSSTSRSHHSHNLGRLHQRNRVEGDSRFTPVPITISVLVRVTHRNIIFAPSQRHSPHSPFSRIHH